MLSLESCQSIILIVLLILLNNLLKFYKLCHALNAMFHY